MEFVVWSKSFFKPSHSAADTVSPALAQVAPLSPTMAASVKTSLKT
jgi:hypothetical protein